MSANKMIIKREGKNPNFLAYINAKGLKDGDEVRSIDYGFFIDEEVASYIKGNFKESFHIHLWRKYKVYTDEELEEIIKKEKKKEKERLEQAEKMAKYKDYLKSV